MGALTESHNIASNIIPIRETLPRKSMEEALYDAWQGKAPQNPHNDPDLLAAEALIANDIFNTYLRPALRIAIGAPHYIEGPAKKPERAKKKKGEYGDNCDWARHSHLLKDMDMAQTATDMLAKRGVLTLKGAANLPLTLYVVDTDNTFTQPDEKKPGLRMINTKFLIPLQLKDGTESYHVLELRSYLAASAESYELSEKAYQNYRQANSLAKAFESAADKTADIQATKRLNIRRSSAADAAKEFLAERTRINLEDAERNGANGLIGYVPESHGPTTRDWGFTTIETYLQNKYQENAAAAEAHFKMA